MSKAFEYGMSNPKFLTCQLIKDDEKDECYFTQANLRDYKEFTHSNIKLRPLAERLIEALTDKSLIQYKNKRIYGDRLKWVMIINDKVISGF